MHLKKRVLILGIFATFFIKIIIFSTRKQTGRPHEVEGWNINTSKNVVDYISENIEPHILPKSFCDKKLDLLVIVYSRISNFKARQSIRETWGLKGNFSIYFLVGEDRCHNYETKLLLKSESEKYDDIIQERFIDSYNNLTLKSVNMLKLFHLYCAESYNYLLKIDDDVFLIVENLLEMLNNRNSTKNLLLGKLMKDTKPIRNFDSKWYVPFELYPGEKYPDYLCGPTYLMSADVAEKLYYCTLETPIFFIEDAYITGICAKKINVIPQHDAKFTCITMKKYICLHRKLYTLHYYTPDEMYESHIMLKKKSCPAQGSFLEWLYSTFR